MSETILTNALVVARSEVFSGTVVLEAGWIKALERGRSRLPAAQDLEGDHLLPGLIEMHTDHLERHLIPRPKVVWPSALAALLAHDAQVAAAGITTVLDAVFLGQYYEGSLRRELVNRSVAAVKEATELGFLKADHFLHLRCELPDPDVLEFFQPYAGEPLTRLVSLNDHTPGQRQWREMKSFLAFHRDKGWTESDLARITQERRELQERHSPPNRREILAACRRLDLPLASHDDTTPTDVAEAAGDGVSISEFPTTLAAARTARALGLKIVAGAPNLVRGASHSGNISAAELAEAQLLDGLSSDYVPAGLLQAAFLLHQRHTLPLFEAVAKVSANVADMIRLPDRGRLAPGFRADLVRVKLHQDLPVVRTVWRQGRPVA